MNISLKKDLFGSQRRFRLEYGNWAYQLLWHNHNALLRMLYISIPFALFICYLMILITSGVLPLTEPPVPLKEGMLYYSFFYDLTNSFVLPYLLFFIYLFHFCRPFSSSQPRRCMPSFLLQFLNTETVYHTISFFAPIFLTKISSPLAEKGPLCYDKEHKLAFISS